ncbi:hypothetical protein KSP40_PGU006359 [Platanthera guangdongensis]|uniref:Reverse transcriptase domain-containing protein n=1 Tax=Platanthera guangdongensis TaxID=2320717 RepID=A0ABR2MC54_9ASPA
MDFSIPSVTDEGDALIHTTRAKSSVSIAEIASWVHLPPPVPSTSAGETYQRMMDRIFREQKGRKLEIYVDDLMIKSRDLRSHVSDLEDVAPPIRHIAYSSRSGRGPTPYTTDRPGGYSMETIQLRINILRRVHSNGSNLIVINI